jgi:hypothetical protein
MSTNIDRLDGVNVEKIDWERYSPEEVGLYAQVLLSEAAQSEDPELAAQYFTLFYESLGHIMGIPNMRALSRYNAESIVSRDKCSNQVLVIQIPCENPSYSNIMLDVHMGEDGRLLSVVYKKPWAERNDEIHGTPESVERALTRDPNPTDTFEVMRHAYYPYWKRFVEVFGEVVIYGNYNGDKIPQKASIIQVKY